MWPCGLHGRLFLIRIQVVHIMGLHRWQSPEEIVGEHEDDVLCHCFRELARACVDIVDQLQQGLPLDLLLSDISGLIREVEGVAAQMKLSDEELLLFRGGHLSEGGEGLCIGLLAAFL